MADRVLRGSRLGAVSYENERSQEPAARIRIEFDCPHGHHFGVVFAQEADLPVTWDCTSCGETALAVNGVAPAPRASKPVRTHWDMLIERRTVADLETLLAERLAELRGTTALSRRKSA